MSDLLKQKDMFGFVELPSAVLAKRFGAPPFTVLSARDGDWQERKRKWLALGIQSELGRGGQAGEKLTMSETVQRLKPGADQALKRSGGQKCKRPTRRLDDAGY